MMMAMGGGGFDLNSGFYLAWEDLLITGRRPGEAR
jgi:hypothetical protein